MQLLLGSHVLEHGNRVGRLAGFELEPAERRIRRIVFSVGGNLGPQAMTRPLAAVTNVRGSTIELSDQTNIDPLPAVADVVLLSRATRVTARGQEQGRLIGIAVDPTSRTLLSVSGRRHWWSGRITIDAKQIDCSIPGELRSTKSDDTRAA
jgi:hypothetical protein